MGDAGCSRDNLVAAKPETDSSSSSGSDDEDQAEAVVPQVPPSNFSNVCVQNSTNVHFGNSAVYHGDVTVVMSPVPGGDLDNRTLLAVAAGAGDLNEDDEQKLQRVTRILSGGVLPQPQQQPPAVDFSQKYAQEPTTAGVVSYKKLILILVTLFIILGLCAALIVIWTVKFDSSSDDDPYYPPDYDNASTFFNNSAGIAPVYSRVEWLAQPVKGLDNIKHPIQYYILSHSATGPCFNKSQCVLQMRIMQMYHIESFGWADIGYNFVVGGDGGIYEGRGWEKIGAHAKGYNNVSIGLNFIGTFIDVLPTKAQLHAAHVLIAEGVRLGKVRRDYKLIGHRQVSETESPGTRLFKEIQNWPNWDPMIHRPPYPIG